MRYITKQSVIISLFLVVFAITAICVRVEDEGKTSEEYMLGGLITAVPEIISSSDMSLSRQTISIINEKMSNLNETYFRPSKLKAMNNSFININDFNQTFKDGTVPPGLMDTPLDSLINYFSILQQAANLTEEKTGGCGTIGYAKIPYPAAYNFLSENNKKGMSYTEYLKSFEGIGHINLIKIIPVISDDTDKFKYFIELEILEGSGTGATAFNYYTGDITLVKEKKSYYIDSLFLTPEDFFCAAYHGWAHNAESYVEIVYGNWCGMIMKQYAPQENDFTKEIIVDGTDGKKYMFKFAKLTNGTDSLINTLIMKKDEWVPVIIDVDKCLGKIKSQKG